MPRYRDEFLQKSDIYLELIADSHSGSEIGNDAKLILHERKSLRDEEAALKRDALDREDIDVAKAANRIASDTKIWAIVAAIIATFAIIMAAYGEK